MQQAPMQTKGFLKGPVQQAECERAAALKDKEVRKVRASDLVR